MTESLFRKEALEAHQDRWLGGISLGQPLSLWLLTAFAICVAAVIISILVFGEYTRRNQVVGQLVPSLGVATVVAPTTGILVEVRVEEGQRVQAGDILAVIAVPRVTLSAGDTAQALQRSIKQRQDSVINSYTSQRQQMETQRTGLAAQIYNTQAELSQIDAELSTRQEQHRLAEKTLERFQGLREKQFVTDLQLQQQQVVVLEQLGIVQALKRQSLNLHGHLAQLKQAHHELPARMAALNAGEQRDHASLTQESVETLSHAEAVIQAPVTGTVSTLLSQTGQAIQSGQPLLSLLPVAGELEAHLLVPSRAVGFIEPGDAVLLRYQAFPYQKFGHYGGRVVRISRSAPSLGELDSLLDNAKTVEPYYRIVVSLNRPTVRAFGKDEPLKPGMLLEGDILGERRKLWEWAIEPLYALSGRVDSL